MHDGSILVVDYNDCMRNRFLVNVVSHPRSSVFRDRGWIQVDEAVVAQVYIDYM